MGQILEIENGGKEGKQKSGFKGVVQGLERGSENGRVK